MRCVHFNEIQFIDTNRKNAAELSNGLNNGFKVYGIHLSVTMCVSLSLCLSILKVYTIHTHIQMKCHTEEYLNLSNHSVITNSIPTEFFAFIILKYKLSMN